MGGAGRIQRPRGGPSGPIKGLRPHRTGHPATADAKGRAAGRARQCGSRSDPPGPTRRTPPAQGRPPRGETLTPGGEGGSPQRGQPPPKPANATRKAPPDPRLHRGQFRPETRPPRFPRRSPAEILRGANCAARGRVGQGSKRRTAAKASPWARTQGPPPKWAQDSGERKGFARRAEGPGRTNRNPGRGREGRGRPRRGVTGTTVPGGPRPRVLWPAPPPRASPARQGPPGPPTSWGLADYGEPSRRATHRGWL